MAEVRLGLTATPKYDVTKDTLEYISTEPGKGRYRSSFAPFGGGTGLSKDDPLLAASVGYEKFRDGSILPAVELQYFVATLTNLRGSAAIKHKPTGLFAMGVFSISESDDSNVFGGFHGQDAPTMRAWNVQADIQRRLDFLSLNKLGETPLWGRLFRRQEWFCAGKQRRVRNDACALPWWLSQLPQRWCTRRCRQHDPSGKYVPQHTVCDPGYRF